MKFGTSTRLGYPYKLCSKCLLEIKNYKTLRRIEILSLCMTAVFDNNVVNVDSTCI